MTDYLKYWLSPVLIGINMWGFWHTTLATPPFSSPVEVHTPPGSSVVSVDPDYGPFAVTLILGSRIFLVSTSIFHSSLV